MSIDQSGYVVRVNKKCKLKIGDLCLFGRKKLQVLDKSNTIKGYEKYEML